MSDLNKILAFRDVMPYLGKKEQEELARALGMNIEEAEKRFVGKNKEDEFILILFLMGACKSIAGFDEGLSQLLNTATSDLLIELKSGEKFMLEIKHTNKDQYSISMGNLQKRIDYAEKWNLELYFAISIKGFWLLFDSSYLKKKKGKIEVSDYTASRLDEKLGCMSYMFFEGLKIRSVYSTNPGVKSTGIFFEPYGNLVSYELYYREKKIFRVRGKNSSYLSYTMILEALQDRLSMGNQVITHSGDYTIIEESFSEKANVISEYKFLLAPLEHTIYNETNKIGYTPHVFLEQAKEDRNLLNMSFQLGHIRGMMQFLANHGVDIMYIKSNRIYRLEPQNP